MGLASVPSGGTSCCFLGLDELLADWPDNAAIALFRAFTLHDMGRDSEALRTALELVLASSADPEVQRYLGSLTDFTATVNPRFVEG